jgi:Chaperone of endosialidase
MKTLLKPSFLIILFYYCICSETNCQIKVFSNNYVGINWTTTPASRLVLNAAGNSTYQAYFYNPNISTGGATLALLSETGTGSNNHIMSLAATINLGAGNYLYGAKAVAYNTTALSTGRAYGVYGLAGNASQGFNYGVYGYLYGTRYGAAVFGTTASYGDLALTQQWAGYFRGDVKVETVLWVNATSYTSDAKLKDNVVSLNSQNSLDNIMKINSVSYNLKQIEIRSPGDSSRVQNYYNENDQAFKKTKYGVIAQELQQIYPEMVYQDGEGNLGVAYTELIPVLINALQAQEKKISDLEEKISKITGESTAK